MRRLSSQTNNSRNCRAGAKVTIVHFTKVLYGLLRTLVFPILYTFASTQLQANIVLYSKYLKTTYIKNVEDS